MSTIVWIAMIVVGIAILAGAIVSWRARHRRERRSLQDRFLSEYDRTVRVAGDRDAAEQELQRRLDRRNVIQLHDIDARRRDAIRNDWLAVQVGFVDDPTRAVTRAARLVHHAMTERGYPDDGADRQIELLSVDHADLVPEFRRAHLSTLRSRAGDADTEEMRQAFTRYRAVFDRLVESTPVTDASER